MQIFADFMYSMILKYSDKVDLDSLPDPEVFLTGKGIDETEVKETKVDYKGKQLLLEYEGLNEDAQKRLLTYAKKLWELMKLEDI